MSSHKERNKENGRESAEKQREERKDIKEEKKEKKERKRRKKRKRGREERKRKKKDSTASSSNLRRSDNRSTSGLELNSVYSTRATLQEVGILPILVISTLRAVWQNFWPMIKLPCLTLHTVQIL